MPVWAIGGIAVVALGAIGFVGYAIYPKPHVAVTTAAQNCANQPQQLASLFSDGQTTMIRLSNPDLSNMRILRTEPANVMPGMFGPLLALSGDSSRLAYVTAGDEVLDNAHIDYIDVANPAVTTVLAAVPSGLWVVTPAWSPDNKMLAFVKLNTATSSAGSEHFELWVADTTTQPLTVTKQADLVADNFTNGNSAAICWTTDNRIVLIPTVPNVLPAPSPTPLVGVPTPTPPAVSAGTSCGVPIMSQNDPAWRQAIMHAGGDSIGGYGCALTSAAMMLNYFGASLTPPQLSACLGSGADPIAWGAVPTCTKGVVSGGISTAFSWSALDAILASGRPAIVGMLGGMAGSHFVVVTAGGGGVAGNYHITDPWDASTYKTLGSYELAGFNPFEIVSYNGVGRNCGSLISGVSPIVSTVQDGGASTVPVTISIAPNLKNLKFSTIIELSNGLIPPNAINLPIPDHSIGSGLTLSGEGIYQVIIVTQAPSQAPVVTFFKFTIDHTAPAINLSLLNLASAFAAESGQVTTAGTQPASTMALASGYPVVNRPGKLQLGYSDTLSGVASVDYNLDGSGWARYTNDDSFSRTILVPQPGLHSISFRGTDLAGNVSSAVTKYFTVLAPPTHHGSPTPTPHASPTPTPRCTTALVFRRFTASGEAVGGVRQNYITVAWSFSGGCPPFHGTITDTYIGGTVVRHHKDFPTALAGTWIDNFACSAQNIGQQSVTFTIVFTDSAGHHAANSKPVSAFVC